MYQVILRELLAENLHGVQCDLKKFEESGKVDNKRTSLRSKKKISTVCESLVLETYKTSRT